MIAILQSFVFIVLMTCLLLKDTVQHSTNSWKYPFTFTGVWKTQDIVIDCSGDSTLQYLLQNCICLNQDQQSTLCQCLRDSDTHGECDPWFRTQWNSNYADKKIENQKSLRLSPKPIPKLVLKWLIKVII